MWQTHLTAAIDIHSYYNSLVYLQTGLAAVINVHSYYNDLIDLQIALFKFKKQ